MMAGFEDLTLWHPITEGLILKRYDGQVQTNVPHMVVAHSFDGFEFGYGGSGPADLALNALDILLTHKGHQGERVRCLRGTCWVKAWDLHQDFKRKFIATAPREGCVIPYETLMEWIDEKLKEAA